MYIAIAVQVIHVHTSIISIIMGWQVNVLYMYMYLAFTCRLVVFIAKVAVVMARAVVIIVL